MAIIPNRNPTLLSGELSRATGVSTDTLRHYEKLGILKKPSGSGSGYRLYTTDSLDRVRLIQNALASGFSLKELVQILEVRDAGGAPCRHVVQIVHARVRQLDLEIRQPTHLRDSLNTTVAEWNRRLRQQPNGRAHLLESLPHKQPNGQREEVNEDPRIHRVHCNSPSRHRANRNVLAPPRTAADV